MYLYAPCSFMNVSLTSATGYVASVLFVFFLLAPAIAKLIAMGLAAVRGACSLVSLLGQTVFFSSLVVCAVAKLVAM